MISVPIVTDNIRFAYKWNGYYIIFSQSGNISYDFIVYHISQEIYHLKQTQNGTFKLKVSFLYCEALQCSEADLPRLHGEVFAIAKVKLFTFTHREVWSYRPSEVKFARFAKGKTSLSAGQLHYKVTSLAVRQT